MSTTTVTFEYLFFFLMNLLVRKYFVTNFELKIEMILESVEGQGKSIDIYVFRQSVKKISW